MKTRILYPLLCAALLAFVAVGCQKEEDITPDTPDTIPVGPTYTSADLIPGPAFNDSLPEHYTAIRFVCGDTTVTSGTLLSTDSSAFPIYGNLDGRTWVVTTPADTMYANPDCSFMFKGIFDEDNYDYFSNLTSIDFGPGFSTSKTTDMSSMFAGCTELTTLDLSCFNTANVTDMGWMFSFLYSLPSIDLTSFNTTNVTFAYGMFMYCESLTSIDLSTFNTPNLRNTEAFFADCYSLTSINLTNFNTSNDTTMRLMFQNCTNLDSLDLSNLNTDKLINTEGMFYYCTKLKHVNLSFFNTQNVYNMSAMFYTCPNLTSLDLSNFYTSNVTDMGYMFGSCIKMAYLDLTHFDMSNVTAKTYMCNGLASQNPGCVITCTSATQTSLRQGTNLIDQYINWNIVEGKHSPAPRIPYSPDATSPSAASQTALSQTAAPYPTPRPYIHLSNGQKLQLPATKRHRVTE